MIVNSPGQCYTTLQKKIASVALACQRKPSEILLIVVSKTQPLEPVKAVYQAGCLNFGENRAQEALPKIQMLPSDIHWHFIGTLQSNKINKVVPYFSLIHSVDNLELARKISETSQHLGRVMPILLQVNTSGERSKHGLDADKWRRQLDEINQLKFVRLEGLMTIAPFVEDETIIRHCFRQLRQLKEEWHSKVKEPSYFRQLSMGMSHDYSIAIEEGATLVRIGSAIFGARKSI